MTTTRTDKTDPSRKPNSDKFDFSQYARDLDRADAFGQIDTRGASLRPFLERELQLQASASTGGSETIIRGKAFLRQMPSGEFQLSISRGRNTFDVYYSFNRDELVQYALSLQEEKMNHGIDHAHWSCTF
jgi:hypothetical protein